MTTLEKTIECLKHTPNESAISSHQDAEYTFCEVCEQNIDRFWVFDDFDRLPFVTKWAVTK
jgi:hypothetical protein